MASTLDALPPPLERLADQPGYQLLDPAVVVPEAPPLGGLGATFLALDDARPRVAVRVLVAQEADDATPGSEYLPAPTYGARE